MAQPRISKLANLFLTINDNLIEDDVRNLRSLLAIEEVLGKARVEHATPLEILNMLLDNATIGEGNLGFLVDVLKSLRKQDLAKEAKRLEKEHRMEERGLRDSDDGVPDTSTSEDSGTDESGPEKTEESDTAEILVLAGNLREMEREKQVYVRRRLAPTMKRQQEIHKKKREIGDTTDHKNVGYANTTLKLAFCVIILLLLLALVWRLKTSKESALQRCLKDLRKQEAKGDKAGQIDANIRVAQRYRYLGNTDQAQIHFDTALQLAQQTEDLHKQMHIYYWMGEMQREQLDSPRTAIEHYEQQLALARQLGDRHEEEVAQHRLGLAHEEMREYEAAREWYEKMYMKIISETDEMLAMEMHSADMGELDQAQQAGNGTAGRHEDMQGDLQKDQLHSPRTAIDYYEQHLALARQLGDKHQEGWAYNKLGHAHYEMGEYETALKWQQKYLKMFKESNDKTKQLTGGKNMAASYQALGKLDQARSHYQSALDIAMETGDKQEQEDIAERLDDL